jgi:hypothetical protein
MVDGFPDTFAGMWIHLSDAPYSTAWGNARANWYGASAIPNFQQDGMYDAWPIGSYVTKFQTEQAVPTDVTVDVYGMQVVDSTFELTADVCIEPDGVGKEMRIFIVQVLDHRLASPTYYRNCVMQAADTHGTETVITLAPGECQAVTKTMTFDATSWANQENIKIIAWAQANNYPSPPPAQVYQAGKMLWPFTPFLSLVLSLDTTTPEYIAPGETTDFTVEIADGAETYVPGSGLLHYRFDGGTFLTAPLTDLGGGLYQGTLPAPSCGDVPEYYFSAEGDEGTIVYLPEDAPTSLYTATVATITTIMDDNFELDLGWTVENDPSVTGGAWERGVPADDGLDGDPTTDADGSGQCFLTGNLPGNSDLDGGPTIVISPTFDLSGYSNPALRFDYWWSNDDQDDDPFAVDVSTDDGENWSNMVTILNPPYPVEDWTQATLYFNDYVTPTSTMRVRFSVSDNPNNSKDEGGLDAVWIFDEACEGGCSALEAYSCRDHGAAGILCLDMGVSGGIEPRLGGITELDIVVDDAGGFSGGVAVDCGPCAWTGSASGTADGNTVTVTLDTALPNTCCCEVTLDCGASVCVCGLEGDIDGSGLVSTGDASIIKPKFGQTPTAATAEFDFDVSGLVSTGDFSQVKPKFGNTLQNPCP